MSNPEPLRTSGFHELMREQIRHEFTASQQYIAIAVYFDSDHLPNLARRFYGQAAEERSHALMMVQYLLDRDQTVTVGGLDEVQPTFGSPRTAVEFALEQELRVTRLITTLAKTARDTGDYLGEQFIGWFLEVQVQEIADMKTLLAVLDRAGGNMFDVEEFVARQLRVGAAVVGSRAPKTAGV
jgi:bacterioferritin B